MKRHRIGKWVLLVAVVAEGFGVCGCGGKAPDAGGPAPDPTAGIYDEFLQARTLAAELTAPQSDLDAVARERKIAEDRRTLRNLEAGVASKRALLADARRDLPADSPNESLYFQIWSGHLGDGPKPTFRRLPGGGIEYAGRQFTKDSAMQCAIPARLKGYTHKPFLDCLSTLQSSGASR